MNWILLTCGCALLSSLFSSAASAANFEINNLQNLSQDEFRQLSEELGAALSYKPLEPAAALGITGFDLGVAASATELTNMPAVQKAVSNGTAYSTLPVPTLRATKGLPFNVDVGAMYARVPTSGINLYGAQIKWAILPGDVVLPAVALRGTFTRLNGVNQLGFETSSVDLSISKGFVLLTPYAGVGQVRSRSATDGLPLAQVNLTQGKYFGGVNVNLGLSNIALEADSTGGIKTYSAKLGIRF